MTFFLVLTYSILVLRSKSSAKSVVVAVLGLNLNPSVVQNMGLCHGILGLVLNQNWNGMWCCISGLR